MSYCSLTFFDRVSGLYREKYIVKQKFHKILIYHILGTYFPSFMRKILLFILLFSLVWWLYESIHIYILLGKNDRDRWNTLILDRRGDLLGDISGKDGYSIDYSGSLDSALVKGILAIEDQRFYEHGGTDIVGKIGAIRDNYEAGTIVRGGSTLTEQYIKNTYFPHEPRTLGQKIREALWATIAEIRYTKDELLRKYLNSVYMWNGIYWVESAANIYFSKSSTVLGEGEIVEIISRIHSPNLRQDDLYKSRVSRKLYGKDIREENLEKREKKKAITSGGVAKKTRRNGINEGLCGWMCLCRKFLVFKLWCGLWKPA